MTPRTAEERTIRVVRTECRFSVVERGGTDPAEANVDHGRETGYELTTEATDR